MKHWTAGELLDVEHIATAHSRRVYELIKYLGSDQFATSTESYEHVRERIRRSELAAAALREFCAIKRGEKKSIAA